MVGDILTDRKKPAHATPAFLNHNTEKFKMLPEAC